MLIQENIPLAPLTTLQIGGRARYFAAIHQEEELLEAIAFARRHSLAVYPIGGGSNLVVSDQGYDGLVLQMAIGSSLGIDSALHVRADAGLDWDTFVRRLCEQGISGMECLAGIPGLVGGSPIQNIGAYGQEVATALRNVRALDLRTMRFVDIPHAACGFGYRTSIFNSTHRGHYLITRVDFAFDPHAVPDLSYADLAGMRGTNPAPLDVYHAVRAIRDRKAMVIHPGVDDPNTRSAGSFFKNPVVPHATLDTIAERLSLPASAVPHWPAPDNQVKLPAAWLIEQAGFPRGFCLGPVGISTRHTLALTNRSGTATAADLFRLRDHLVDGVEARFGIRLEQEPVLLGHGADDSPNVGQNAPKAP